MNCDTGKFYYGEQAIRQAKLARLPVLELDDLAAEMHALLADAQGNPPETLEAAERRASSEKAQALVEQIRTRRAANNAALGRLAGK